MGVGLLVGYTIFVFYMKDMVLENEVQWARLQYLMNGVEALAFAAAGFFFGREVNRGRAEAAETLADSQAQRAAGAEKKAATATARGQAISAQLQEIADPVPTHRSAAGVAPMESLEGTAAGESRQLREVARLARRWFPPS